MGDLEGDLGTIASLILSLSLLPLLCAVIVLGCLPTGPKTTGPRVHKAYGTFQHSFVHTLLVR